MVKSEPPVLNRRRSIRQNPSPKSEQQSGSDDASCKEELKDTDAKELVTVTIGNLNERNDLTTTSDPPLLALRGGKDIPPAAKDEKVKKWIEDSNLLSSSKVSKSMDEEEEDCDKEDSPHPPPSSLTPSFMDEKATTMTAKKGRRPKLKRAFGVAEKKKKVSEEMSDSDHENEAEIKSEVDEQEDKEISTIGASDHSAENNNLPTEKDRTTDTTTDALSAFCNIVENVQKLQSHPSVESTTSTIDSSAKSDVASPTKAGVGERKRKYISKRRRTQSTSETTADDTTMRSPKEKKEKQISPPLEYNSDFVSDLGMCQLHYFLMKKVQVFCLESVFLTLSWCIH